MKHSLRIASFSAAIFVNFALGASAAGGDEIVKSFPIKPKIEIKTVSGDCVVKAGNVDRIEVTATANYEPSSSFAPRFSEKEDRLVIEEKMLGSNHGESHWKVIVPAKTDISFSSASGGFTAGGLKSRINANTSSGDISLTDVDGSLALESASGTINLADVSGDLKVETASGSIEIKKAKGTIELQSASGDIKAEELEGKITSSVASGDIDVMKLTITDQSSFSNASGDMNIILDKTPNFDLELSTASGKATLDYHGNGIKGSFEFTARADKGTIVSPVKFDREETYTRDNHEYVDKFFTRDSETPKIKITTATGSAILKK